MAAVDVHRLLRRLPSIDDVMRSPGVQGLLALYPRSAIVTAARSEIEGRRQALLALNADTVGQSRASATPRLFDVRSRAAGATSPGLSAVGARDREGIHGPAIHAPPGNAPQSDAEDVGLVDTGAALMADLGAQLAERLRAASVPTLRRALNATGVVLHTNLGRAPLSARALDRIRAVASGYCTLEYDPVKRHRSSRQVHAETLLRRLTGAEAAVVVNNNAAAVLLVLATLAPGRPVIVSRGELIEVGGGFRIPDVMRASGAVLVEVGTTNKTRVSDYANAVVPETALLLKVHRSNFVISGFTAETPLSALCEVGRSHNIPVMVDLGSGALADMVPFGLPPEPTVAEAVRAGADIVTFSGDKLLGGPQAGIIVGRSEFISRLAIHPLMRALRPDKLSLAALEATLESYRDGSAAHQLPVLRMLAASAEDLSLRKDHLCERLGRQPALTISSRRLRSAVGGGALPSCEPDTWVVEIQHASLGAEAFCARLAMATPPLVTRIVADRVVLDVRTLEGDDLEAAATVVRMVAGDHTPEGTAC